MKYLISILFICILCSCSDNQSISKHELRLDAIDDAGSSANIVLFDEDLNKEVTIPYSSDIFVISLSALKSATENRYFSFTNDCFIYTGVVVKHIVFVLTYYNGEYCK